MNPTDDADRDAVESVDFNEIEWQFNENVGAFLAQVRHMNQQKIPALMKALSVSKKTYLEMEKGKRQYRMHIIAWWSFVMGLSPLHILAQSDYFGHLPIGDYRNIRQIKLALLLQRVPSTVAMDALQRLIDDCPRNIHRDIDRSMHISIDEMEDARRFLYSADYYSMIADAMRRFIDQNGLTRREFADFLKVTQRTVRRILNGEVALNYSYYARFYLSTGVYPLKVVEEPAYMRVRLKLEQRFFLINDLIAGYGSQPERLDDALLELGDQPVDAYWRSLFTQP
ncbi:helix-turn-helix domain-containing protein [Saccharospirillum mangrovi]|uniref:helix-turn-helix domain-containing protein n=1 Tax=Saccharospirillum mangrovi TaxID=2161747 RepID=UPI0013005C1B|nr:helix-turn-helix transcriptional regulator [Saccharospirillum mangrovi]